jgi:t-SNARE complex subunit (syntaxin)
MVQKVSAQVKKLETSNQLEKVQRDRVAKSFKDVIVEYQGIQSRYKQKFASRLERQYRIVNPNASEEEVRQAVEGDGNVFAQQLKSSSLRGAARRALEEAQDQHRDIIQLEESILELHQMFVEMSTLVEEQGQKIETVETYVQEAEVQLEVGVQELDQGVELAKSSRKKRYILCACCVVLLIVIGIIVFIYVVNPLIQANSGGARPSQSVIPR